MCQYFLGCTGMHLQSAAQCMQILSPEKVTESRTVKALLAKPET